MQFSRREFSEVKAKSLEMSLGSLDSERVRSSGSCRWCALGDTYGLHGGLAILHCNSINIVLVGAGSLSKIVISSTIDILQCEPCESRVAAQSVGILRSQILVDDLNVWVWVVELRVYHCLGPIRIAIINIGVASCCCRYGHTRRICCAGWGDIIGRQSVEACSWSGVDSGGRHWGRVTLGCIRGGAWVGIGVHIDYCRPAWHDHRGIYTVITSVIGSAISGAVYCNISRLVHRRACICANGSHKEVKSCK